MLNYNIRKLSINDFFKDYLKLLSQLTSCPDMPFHKFEEIFNSFPKNHHIYVISYDNKIICSGTLIIENKFINGGKSVAHVEDIVVHQNYRNMGLGKKMINHLIDLAKKNNCYKIILDCNKNVQQFYNILGFKKNNIQMSIYF